MCISCVHICLSIHILHCHTSIHPCNSPKERALRKNQAAEEDTTRSDSAVATKESKDYSEYFLELDKMRWQERQREMKRIAIERAEKQREAQEQRTSENVVEDQADDDLQVVNEAQPVEPQAQEIQSSEENESSQEAIDMDEYGLLEQEFSTEYDMSEQLEEVQEVATEVEFSTEYDISEQLEEEEPRVQEVATEVEFSTEYDLLEHLREEEEVEESQGQESQEESNTESDISEERTDNALQRAIDMLRRTERPK